MYSIDMSHVQLSALGYYSFLQEFGHLINLNRFKPLHGNYYCSSFFTQLKQWSFSQDQTLQKGFKWRLTTTLTVANKCNKALGETTGSIRKESLNPINKKSDKKELPRGLLTKNTTALVFISPQLRVDNMYIVRYYNWL